MDNERPLPSSLRTSAFRLALAYCGLFTLGVSVLLSAIYFITARALAAEVDNVIIIELEALADEYDREGAPGVAAQLTRLHEGWGRAGAAYLLVDRDFTPRAGNLTSWPFKGLPRAQWPEFEIETQRADKSVHHRVRARIFTLTDGYLLVGTDISQRRNFQHSFRLATLWGIGSTALLGGLLGFWLSRRLMLRVRAMSAECELILAGDLSRRLPVAGVHDEFDALALAVNRVLARLDEQTHVLRATFDSTAHDLRGPLSRLRGRLEELLRSAALPEPAGASVERALQDLDRVQRTLTTLLQIAQAESRAPLADSARVNLGALAREIAALYEPAARDQGLRLHCDAADAFLTGSRQLIAQLLSNLIENSLKHGGGEIHIEVHDSGSGARLTVSDRGPGIAPQDRERVLRPFVRLAGGSTAGSGLGLSLVAAIARLHEAQLSLEDNTPGLRVTLRFPLPAG